QLRRYSAEGHKGILQSAHQHRHGLAWVELQPHQPRVSKHYQKGKALAPRQAKLGEVDLGLKTRRRLKAHHRIRRRDRPHLPDVLLHLRVAADVTRRADLIEQPRRTESRILAQSRLDDLSIAIDLAWHWRPRRVVHRTFLRPAVDLSGVNPVVERAPADAQRSRDISLAQPLLEVVA